MSRRSSVIEDLMSLAARLPWFYGVGLAAVSLAVLHVLTAQLSVLAGPTSTANTGTVAFRQLVSTLALLFQVVVPTAFLAGAMVSIFRRRQGVVLLSDAQASGPAAIARMSWGQFEQLIGAAFRQRGFTVLENIQAGADGGVDLVLKREARVFLVQCKHWKRTSVGVSTIRELYGVVVARGAKGGFVVTSGAFTDEARDFALECKVELIDGQLLQAMLTGVIQESPATVASSAVPARHCPKCGCDMQLRTARRGLSTGKQFWGCARFPQCRATAEL